MSEYLNCDVGPHSFELLKPTLIERVIGSERRCRLCMVIEEAHPVGWSPARPIGDRNAPRFDHWLSAVHRWHGTDEDMRESRRSS